MNENENESNESRETVADIVADIRERAENAMRYGERLVHNEAVANMLTFVADRIDAAARREHMFPHSIKVPIEVVPTGNAAAMREALLKVRKIAALNICECVGDYSDERIIEIVDSALSAPARNCDVGTVEEQTRRMDSEYCRVQKECYESPSGKQCPLYRTGVDCRLTWAQMPYKAPELEGGE